MKPSPASRHTCSACGYPGLSEPPRTASGGGSYEICPSCGYQFGVDDEDRRISPAAHRRDWIEGGMTWFSRGIPKPPDWKPRDQLRAVMDTD